LPGPRGLDRPCRGGGVVAGGELGDPRGTGGCPQDVRDLVCSGDGVQVGRGRGVSGGPGAEPCSFAAGVLRGAVRVDGGGSQPPVPWTPTATKLVNELVEAADEKVLAKTIARYGRVDLLCIDELGYMELDRRGAELLCQVLTEREEKNSVAIASNESFSGWTKTFTDPRLCAAIVDRLTSAPTSSKPAPTPTDSPTP